MKSMPSTRPPLSRNVKLLGWISFLNDVASEMIYPLLPKFLQALGGNTVQLGAIEGLAESTASLVKLFAGGWSDRLRIRKAFVVGGYALAAAIRPLIGLLTAPWQLVAARGADRLGKGIRTAPRDALIADSTAPGQRGRAFGFNRAMDHGGAALGPLVAATFLWLWPDQLRPLFLLTVIPGLIVVPLLLVGLREHPAQTKAGKPFHLSLAPFDRSFRWLLLSVVVFTLGNSSDAFLLWRAGELGVPSWALPLLWSAFHVVKSFGSIVVGRAVDRLGGRPMILAGWLVYAVVYLLFAWATAAWHAWLLFLGYALFYALTEPAEKTLVANLVATENTGLAFGWFNFAIGIAALPASVIFGALYRYAGAPAAFGWSASLALLAAAMLACMRNRK
jgi:MFS family permease